MMVSDNGRSGSCANKGDIGSRMERLKVVKKKKIKFVFQSEVNKQKIRIPVVI